MEKRRKKKQKRVNAEITVATWNQQGVSVRQQNRARLKNVIDYITRQGWEITLVSERRADKTGVIWLGKGRQATAVVHSLKSGIILRGTALDQWVRGKQKMDFKERSTRMQTI